MSSEAPIRSRAQEVLPRVQALALHQHLGIGPIHAEHGRAHFEVTVGNALLNPAGALHGGVIYSLCDVACYCALLSQLAPDEEAATHDLQVSLLRAASAGQVLRFEGVVIKRGRQLAFGSAQVHADGKLLARAQVTKSILSLHAEAR